MTPNESETGRSFAADHPHEDFSGHIKVRNRNNNPAYDQDFAFFPRKVGIQRTGKDWTIDGDASETPNAPSSAWKPFAIRFNTGGDRRTVELIFDGNRWELGEVPRLPEHPAVEIRIETQGDTEVRVTYLHPDPGQGPDNGAWILRPGTVFTAIDRQ